MVKFTFSKALLQCGCQSGEGKTSQEDLLKIVMWGLRKREFKNRYRFLV